MIRKGQVILALSNPNPEISTEDARAAGLRSRRTAGGSTTRSRSPGCSGGRSTRGRARSTTG
jgi:hypothetical protein